jgi:DNA invertase Pin-like site-specific DNA recombinase
MSQKKLLAYSYIRFSSPSQANGDSLRRQQEMTEAYCQRRDWTLSTDTYRDLGVSAWRGKNALVGNLGEFLKAVKSGAVQAGSALIVESLDRITRQGIDEGYDLIKKILKSGVLLVTLSPEREFDVAATRSLSKGALEIQLILERAAEESERKSERVGKAWQQKKRKAALTGAPMSAKTPNWLKLIGGRWQVEEEAALAVRRIYGLAKAGFGLTVITRKLNAAGVPVIGRAKHWGRSYVGKILSSRAVVGEYQPYKGRWPLREKDGPPIPGYFPAIITEAEWYAARAALESRRGKVGRTPKNGVNIFAGLLHDARDGGGLQQKHKSKRGSNPLLVSYRAAQGVRGCRFVSFPFPAFEEAILAHLREIDPAEILPEPEKEDRTLELAGRLAEVELEIEKLKNRIQARYSDGLADVLERQEEEQRSLAEQLTVARQEAASPSGEAWGEFGTLASALESAPDRDEARLRLRAALRRMVEGFWCLFLGKGAVRLAVVQVVFAKSDKRRTYLLVYRPKLGGGRRSSRPAQSWSGSLVEEGGVCVDLRRAVDVAALETALAGMNLKDPFGKTGADLLVSLMLPIHIELLDDPGENATSVPVNITFPGRVQQLAFRLLGSLGK